MAIFDSIGGFISGFGRAVAGVFNFVGSLVGILGGWFFGLPGFLIDIIWYPIFGNRLTMDMRVRYIILADERGRPLLQPGDITATAERTAEIMMDRADIEMLGQNVMIAFGAPGGALDVTSPAASFFEQVTEVGSFFNGLAGYGLFTRTITVFVVRSMVTHDARSFGPVTNYVMVTADVFTNNDAPETSVAHELGHQCGLLHRGTLGNLMYESNTNDQGDFRGTSLSTWQASVIRISRFVWY